MPVLPGDDEAALRSRIQAVERDLYVEVLARLVESFGDKVFHTVIAKTVRFPETTVAGEPITTYASGSPGAASYRMLAREVLARCPGA